MKLIDRQPVEGTMPIIYIGHREYKRPDGSRYAGRRWYAEWCIHARHHQQALGTTIKHVAIRIAHDIRRRIDEGQVGPKSYKLNSTQLKDQYIELKRNEERAPKTLEKYIWGLSEFEQWCINTRRYSVLNFNVADFWAYNRWMADTGRSSKTRYDRLILIKQAFKFAAKQRLIPEYLLNGISLNKPEPNEQPCFTEQQIAILLAIANPHEAAIFAVMAYTGMRIGEVRDLRWRDILWNAGKNGFIVVRRGGSRKDQTKSGRVRRIPINPYLKPYLANLSRAFDHVFTARPSRKHPEGGAPISERRLLVSLKRTCKRAKLDNARQYKLHSFRHTFASMCARSNIAYKYALEWMGHKSSDILDLYYKMFDDVAESAMKTIRYLPPNEDAA